MALVATIGNFRSIDAADTYQDRAPQNTQNAGGSGPTPSTSGDALLTRRFLTSASRAAYFCVFDGSLALKFDDLVLFWPEAHPATKKSKYR